MLAKTYPIDRDGGWFRRIDDFTEDVVVVCASCNAEPEGRFSASDGAFTFVPADDDGAE